MWEKVGRRKLVPRRKLKESGMDAIRRVGRHELGWSGADGFVFGALACACPGMGPLLLAIFGGRLRNSLSPVVDHLPKSAARAFLPKS
jgi:hypothetical protein